MVMIPIVFTTLVILSFQLHLSFVLGFEPLENRNLFKPPKRQHAVDISNSTWIPPGFMTKSTIWNPLLRRQEDECAYPVACDAEDTWCCPAGSQCCEFPSCCPDDSNCRGNNNCCPKSAQTCGGKVCTDPGSVCCGSFVCPPSSVCNTNGGENCCESDELHCPDACCPPDSQCAPIPGYCAFTESTTQTETFTRSSFSTSSTFITSVSTFTSTSMSTSFSTSLSTSTSTSAPSCTLTPFEKRQRPFSKTCNRECDSTGQTLPVWEISKVDGETDELILSMCAGMAARIAAGTVGSPVDGEDVITYNGQGVRNTVPPSLCRGFCTEQTKNSDTKFQCDEYPPATLNPQGGQQTRVCIPAYQNSGTQGPMLSQLLKNCNIQKGDKVLVRINGGCKQYSLPSGNIPSLTKRHNSEIAPRAVASGNTINLSSSNATLRDPYGDGSLLYINTDIDNLANGNYSFTVTFDGVINNLTILNEYGDVYANVDSPSGQETLSFNISDDSFLPLSLIAYTDQAVNVSYVGVGQLAQSNTTSFAMEFKGYGSPSLYIYAIISSMLLFGLV